MGITRIADVTGLDTIGIPVVMVYRPNSRSVVVAQGKGLDLLAAKVSGAMESVEVFMAERITKPLLLGSFNDLMLAGTLSGIEMGLRLAGVPHKDGGVTTALDSLARIRGLEREQIMAIGDNLNDLEMLEYAGRAVVMGNASEEIRSLARRRGWRR